MNLPNITELFRTQKRFLRSAHLERDFRDPTALEGYIIPRKFSGHSFASDRV